MICKIVVFQSQLYPCSMDNGAKAEAGKDVEEEEDEEVEVIEMKEKEVKDEESVGGADGEDKEGEDQKEQVSLQDSVGIFC